MSDAPPSSVSCGTVERRILARLHSSTARFSVRGFETEAKIPKSTICSALKRLQQKELIEKPHMGNYVITEAGRHYLQASGVGQDDRQGGRAGRLNVHRIEYMVRIEGGNWEELAKKANKVTERQMNNWTQRDIAFDAGTIRLNTKTAILYVHELEGGDADLLAEQSNDVAFKYVAMLEDAGFKCTKMRFDGAHWARVRSTFAEALVRDHGKFKLTLPNGRHFWVDNSEGLEDETNDQQYRSRLDEFLKDLSVSSSIMSDVDAIKDILGKTIIAVQTTSSQLQVLAQAEQVTTQHVQNLVKLQMPQPSLQVPKGIPEYVG